jgi:hypothetical protein
MFEDVLDTLLIELETFEITAFEQVYDHRQMSPAELNQSWSAKGNQVRIELVELDESRLSDFNDAQLVDMKRILAGL